MKITGMLVTLLINQYETTGMLRLFTLFPHISLQPIIYLSSKLQLYMPLYIVPGNILKIENFKNSARSFFNCQYCDVGRWPLGVTSRNIILRPTDKKSQNGTDKWNKNDVTIYLLISICHINSINENSNEMSMVNPVWFSANGFALFTFDVLTEVNCSKLRKITMVVCKLI